LICICRRRETIRRENGIFHWLVLLEH
jgi:hypothetical protein